MAYGHLSNTWMEPNDYGSLSQRQLMVSLDFRSQRQPFPRMILSKMQPHFCTLLTMDSSKYWLLAANEVRSIL